MARPKIDPQEAKNICLDMLVKFDEVCSSHGLRYVLDYGTLLGCIRHKGFIPWDDDIDVTMPREDYEKLTELALKDDGLFGKYRFASIYGKNNIYKAYSNIVDPRTITYSSQRNERYFYPLWIDVFPMDFCDETNVKTTFKKVGSRLLKGIRPLMNYKSTLKKLYVSMFNNIKTSIPNLKKADAIAKKSQGGALTNYFSRYGAGDLSDISYYNDFVFKEFENHLFRVPREYDKRLTSCYGNYMELPPEDKRVPHFVGAYYVSSAGDKK